MFLVHCEETDDVETSNSLDDIKDRAETLALEVNSPVIVYKSISKVTVKAEWTEELKDDKET